MTQRGPPESWSDGDDEVGESIMELANATHIEQNTLAALLCDDADDSPPPPQPVSRGVKAPPPPSTKSATKTAPTKGSPPAPPSTKTSSPKAPPSKTAPSRGVKSLLQPPSPTYAKKAQPSRAPSTDSTFGNPDGLQLRLDQSSLSDKRRNEETKESATPSRPSLSEPLSEAPSDPTSTPQMQLRKEAFNEKQAPPTKVEVPEAPRLGILPKSTVEENPAPRPVRLKSEFSLPRSRPWEAGEGGVEQGVTPVVFGGDAVGRAPLLSMNRGGSGSGSGGGGGSAKFDLRVAREVAEPDTSLVAMMDAMENDTTPSPHGLRLLKHDAPTVFSQSNHPNPRNASWSAQSGVPLVPVQAPVVLPMQKNLEANSAAGRQRLHSEPKRPPKKKVFPVNEVLGDEGGGGGGGGEKRVDLSDFVRYLDSSLERWEANGARRETVMKEVDTNLDDIMYKKLFEGAPLLV